MSETIKLRLLGYVRGSKIPNTFFTDYAETDIPAHVEFAIQKINGELVPPDAVTSFLTIRRIRDQFGTKLDVIPEGWKVICTIEFLWKPTIVENLKTLDEWDYNARAVNLELVVVD